MKKVLMFLVLILCCFTSIAQIKLYTKGERLADFPSKIMKVVESGDPVLDLDIKHGLKNIWSISPFEICTKKDFDLLKNNSDYYFMLTLEEPMHKNLKDTLISILIVKGGTGDQVDKMLEVAKFPICTKHRVDNRVGIFLPAILNHIQNYIETSLSRGFSWIKPKSLRSGNKKVVFISTADLSPSLGLTTMSKYSKKHIVVTDNDNANKLFLDGMDALFSYCISPTIDKESGHCIKMLFDGRTYTLYYLKSSKISDSQDNGFVVSDIRKIARGR